MRNNTSRTTEQMGIKRKAYKFIHLSLKAYNLNFIAELYYLQNYLLTN